MGHTRVLPLVGLGLLFSLGAHASHYVSFSGGYEQLPSGNFSGAFTDLGFNKPASTVPSLGTRLGNESPEGALRLEVILSHPLTQAQEPSGNYVELGSNRWGVQAQLSLSPGAALAPFLGLGGGVAFSDLTVLTASASGVLSERYYYVEPVVGLEMRVSEDFRFFTEFSYLLPFSSSVSVHGADLGATKLSASHWSALAGLSFYFSGGGGRGGAKGAKKGE